MSPNLCGLHDREAIQIALPDTWVLDTVALSESPQPTNYDTRFHWITRVNFGYGSTGTIPIAATEQTVFLERLSKYVSLSNNCLRWIIGNEPNLHREWPNETPIYPGYYADFYSRCREVIHNVGGVTHEVLIAASGPWNDELKYSGNPTGDWIQYFQDVIRLCNGQIDGFSIHAYTHGYNSALVTSEAVMNPPFQNRHYEFRTYQDYCNAIPESLAHLPIYLTESNGNGPWQAVGLMPAMAEEINKWNKEDIKRRVKALIFYRYPRYDEYYIEGKQDVIAEYRGTVQRGYTTPKTAQESTTMKGIVTAELLNVRAGPGTNTPVVGSRSKGNSVEILEKNTAGETLWYRIGDKQWVSANWVSVGGVTEQPTVPTGDSWQRSLAFVLKHEGGWADHPSDPGGATNKGITIGTYTRWREAHGQSKPTKDELRNIPDKVVKEIYYQWYWLPSKANEMAWPMCLCHFDLAVNGGIGRAQEALAANGQNFNKYMAWRQDWYTRLDDFIHFGRGWIRRCSDLIRTVG